jgi:hypothetical protein
VSFQHMSNRVEPVRALPEWFTLPRGRLTEMCVVAITLSTPRHRLLSMVGYRLGDQVEKMDRVAVPKRQNVTEIHRTWFFRRRSILRTAAARPCPSSDCDSHTYFASCLAPTGGSTSTWLVVVKRAPFLREVSPLSSVSSNAHFPPKILPYSPCRNKNP